MKLFCGSGRPQRDMHASINHARDRHSEKADISTKIKSKGAEVGLSGLYGECGQCPVVVTIQHPIINIYLRTTTTTALCDTRPSSAESSRGALSHLLSPYCNRASAGRLALDPPCLTVRKLQRAIAQLQDKEDAPVEGPPRRAVEQTLLCPAAKPGRWQLIDAVGRRSAVGSALHTLSRRAPTKVDRKQFPPSGVSLETVSGP